MLYKHCTVFLESIETKFSYSNSLHTSSYTLNDHPTIGSGFPSTYKLGDKPLLRLVYCRFYCFPRFKKKEILAVTNTLQVKRSLTK